MFSLTLAACGSEPPVEMCPTQVPVVDPASFRIVDVRDDPFEPDMPDAGTSSTSTTTRGRCTSSDARIEALGSDQTFTIETRYCSRLTVEAETLEDIEQGEALQLRLWHATLLPYGPAIAELVVSIDGDEVFEQIVPIPGNSELIADTVFCPDDIPRGTRVSWHVSNHGANSWNWVSLTAERLRPCAR